MTLTLHHYETIDSTMDEAYRLLGKDFSHYIGNGVIANVQTQGRGRHARKWISEDGNLYLSLMLEDVEPSLLSQYAMLWGVVIRQAIETVLIPKVNLQCKWPNDILLDEKKIGGLLIEPYTNGDDKAMIVGLGVNLKKAPSNAQFPATTLEGLVQLDLSPSQLAQIIYEIYQEYHFIWHVKGFEFIRHKWEQVAWRLGERINIRQEDQSVVGVFEKIDAIGAIWIRQDNGNQRRLLAGDLFKEKQNVTSY